MYSIEQRDEQLRGTTAAITYHLGFDRAAQHLITVRMVVSNVNTPELILVMPSWSPGSYKIRDYAGHQGNVQTFVVNSGKRSSAAMKWRDKASIVVTTGGASTIEVEYVVYANERTVRTNHVNRFHAFVVPTATCMYVEGRTEEVHHVLLTHSRDQWPSCSTALSPVRDPNAEGVLLGALNYDILADSPLEIGDHAVRTFDVAGAKHELAMPTNHTLDIDWLAQQIQTIVRVEAEIFGGVPYDRYVFVVQVYPGAGGGLEHARSSINAVDPTALLDKSKVVGLLSLLCHEYFHLWNVKRIRPKELGPFDYTKETYTPMLWLAEGLTSYYDDLLAYRCGFLTAKEYVEAIARDNMSKLAVVPGRLSLSTRDSSYLAWLKLYFQSPDANNRFPSYYLKGGIAMMLLDIYIIDHSDGASSMDDAMRALWKRYSQNPSEGITEDECLSIIEEATKIQVRERVMSWLNGTDELPYDEIFESVGYRVDTTPKQPETATIGEKIPFAFVPGAVWLGWSLADVGGRIVVRTVDDGSPSALAGIGIDDEIVAVDGRRVVSVASAEHYLASAKGAAQITAHCDGRLYTTEIIPMPLPAMRLVEIDKPSKRQSQMRSIWLRRTL